MMKSQARRILNRPRWRPLFDDPKENSLIWVHKNSLPEGGVIVHSRKREVYPEVSGYYIPTLIDCDEHHLARNYVDGLIKLQNSQGFWGLYGKAYLFDTAQIVEGLAVWQKREPKASLKAAIDNALRWCSNQVDSRGMFNTEHHDAAVPEHIQLRSLRNLHAASLSNGNHLLADKFREVAGAYIEGLGSEQLNVLSHFRAYVMDGVSWFDSERAEEYLQGLAKVQLGDGRIPAFPDSNWFCLPAIAQFGILFWQHGMKSEAKKAYAFLRRMQRRSGGFTGGNGEYFPRVELSWSVKFFLDLGNLIDDEGSLTSVFEAGGGE